MRSFLSASTIVLAGVFGAAASMWTFFDSLRNEGFTDDQAMKLTVAYAHGSAGGKLS